MTEAELDNFYAAEYRQLYQGEQGPSPKDLAVQTARAQSLLSFFQSRNVGVGSTRMADSQPVTRHLDIGSSAGLLLQRFQQAYGCQSVGIEPGDAYRTYARSQGLQVYASLAELATIEKGGETLKGSEQHRYDLISLAHVIEHLSDPLDYLVDLRQKWLTPNGFLLIETPNLYGHDCFEVAHLVAYSPHTLEQTLLKAGFHRDAQRVHGQPRSEILPLYLTVLAKPTGVETFAGTIAPEHGVRRKRKFAMLKRRLLSRFAPRKAWLPLST